LSVVQDVPGYVEDLGLANAAVTVNVNGQATYRRNEYFEAAVPVSNSSTSAYPAIVTTQP
jgi:hypothetical protein